VRESVDYAKRRITFGKPLAERQAIQWPLVELATDVQLLRTFVRQTATEMDSGRDRIQGVSDKVSMCNFRANRLVCDAADRAMQVHGGIGYTRHKPFEHIYRHHRRYRITEGSEEIQIRNVAGHLFGFIRR
jgi:acyl-CoA dehydrogenase